MEHNRSCWREEARMLAGRRLLGLALQHALWQCVPGPCKWTNDCKHVCIGAHATTNSVQCKVNQRRRALRWHWLHDEGTSITDSEFSDYQPVCRNDMRNRPPPDLPHCIRQRTGSGKSHATTTRQELVKKRIMSGRACLSVTAYRLCLLAAVDTCD